MPIDFSSLVLGPCMDTFAKTCVITPVATQPLAAPYTMRGVWQVDNITVPVEDGGAFSTRILKFGIKLDEFTVPPNQNDILTFAASDLPMGYRADAFNPSGLVDLVVDNTNPDGQGGCVLFLKRKP